MGGGAFAGLTMDFRFTSFTPKASVSEEDCSLNDPFGHRRIKQLVNINWRAQVVPLLGTFNGCCPFNCSKLHVASFHGICRHMGSSTETVIDHEFFNFFDWDQKYKCLRHHFQYLAQFIGPRGGSGAIRIFSILDYGTSFAVVSTTMDFPSS